MAEVCCTLVENECESALFCGLSMDVFSIMEIITTLLITNF